MDPILPISEVLLDWRLQNAPGDVVKTYWNVVAFLWHEAQRTGRAVLPKAIGPDCEALLERELAFVDDDGCVYIPWLTDAWARVLATSAKRSGAAKVRWAEHQRRRDAARSTSDANALQVHSTSSADAELVHCSSNANSFLPSLVSSPESSSGEEGVQREKGGTPRASRRSRRAPPEFEPAESHRELARQHGVDLAAELEKFRDHEYAAPRTDWTAAFSNWLRRAAEFAPRARASPAAPPGKSRNQAYADRVRAWATGEEPEGSGEVIDITPKEAAQ